MGQKDLFYPNLSVRETLMFASKLKNYATQEKLFKRISNIHKSDVMVVSYKLRNEVKNFHENLVSEILEELNLTSCSNVRVGKCSGGQQKRLSIACELVSRPDILLLDEPTSGLGKLLMITFIPPDTSVCRRKTCLPFVDAVQQASPRATPQAIETCETSNHDCVMTGCITFLFIQYDHLQIRSPPFSAFSS